MDKLLCFLLAKREELYPVPDSCFSSVGSAPCSAAVWAEARLSCSGHSWRPSPFHRTGPILQPGCSRSLYGQKQLGTFWKFPGAPQGQSHPLGEPGPVLGQSRGLHEREKGQVQALPSRRQLGGRSCPGRGFSANLLCVFLFFLPCLLV